MAKDLAKELANDLDVDIDLSACDTLKLDNRQDPSIGQLFPEHQDDDDFNTKSKGKGKDDDEDVGKKKKGKKKKDGPKTPQEERREKLKKQIALKRSGLGSKQKLLQQSGLNEVLQEMLNMTTSAAKDSSAASAEAESLNSRMMGKTSSVINRMSSLMGKKAGPKQTSMEGKELSKKDKKKAQGLLDQLLPDDDDDDDEENDKAGPTVVPNTTTTDVQAELPSRRRTKASLLAATDSNVGPTKQQLKNRRKREKAKLKRSTAASATNTSVSVS